MNERTHEASKEPATVSEATPRRAIVALALGLVSLGLSPILVRYGTSAPGLALAVWRTVFATVLLAPIALPRIGPEVRRFTGRDWRLILGAGVFLGIHFIAWIESLYHTSVASASVLVTTSPLFIAVLGYLVLKERLTRRTVGAIVVAVIGAALIGWGDAADEAFPNAILGNGLALTASLLMAVYLLIGRAVRQHTSFLHSCRARRSRSRGRSSRSASRWPCCRSSSGTARSTTLSSISPLRYSACCRSRSRSSRRGWRSFSSARCRGCSRSSASPSYSARSLSCSRRGCVKRDA
jgi:uncharacterized membrane protein